MRSFRFTVIALATLGLSGCIMSDPPSRGGLGAPSLVTQQPSGYNVTRVNVLVPRSLVVSEDNSYKPAADIVWHGEAAGNRFAQVEKLTRDGITAGAGAFRAGRAVTVDVQVVRFHALTQKTRDSFGGKHELIYALILRDSATGEVLLLEPRVKATVRAAGGAAAQAEEAVGRTQAVVIREAFAVSIQKELGRRTVRDGLRAAVARAAQSPSGAPLN
jgi:hypothetical protein